MAVAREVFNVPEEVETRLWNKYTRDTFELLDKSESTLQVPVFVATDNYTVPDPHESTLISIGWIRIRI